MSAAADTRELILDAAEELARGQGLGALSMRAIAERTGLSAPAAYRHFAHKEALVGALVDRGFRGFVAGLEAARFGIPDPLERLRATFAYYLSFWTNDPRGFEFMAERGGVKNGLSGGAIDSGSFGDIPELTAQVLGPTVPQMEKERIGRWTAVSLYGVALSFSADGTADAERRKEDIDSAADYLIRAIRAAADAQPRKTGA
jgi:AcrR family transcriptional regulator